MIRQRHLLAPDPPHSEEVTAGGDRKLITPWEVNILGTRWIVPAGTTWDQASVPRLLQLFCAKDELGDAATLGHDALFKYRGRLPAAWLAPGEEWRAYTRHEADQFLQATALLEGARPWRVNLACPVERTFWRVAEGCGAAQGW